MLRKKREFTKEHRKNLSRAKKGCVPWNTGLTKKTDFRVLKNAENCSKNHADYSGKNHPHWKGGGRNYWNCIARKTWEDYWKEETPIGYLIHHVDKNVTNNEITNLALLTRKSHLIIHNVRSYIRRK